MRADLARIDALTHEYSNAREHLANQCAMLKDLLQELQRSRQPEIQAAVDACANAYADLEAALESAPDLFVRPRSAVLYGIKVGWQKNPGSIEFEDAKRVCALIHKHLPYEAESLILTTETPLKKALTRLSAQDLKRIGCSIANASDTVLIRPADGWVDKFVDALLKEAVAEAETV